MNDGMTLQIDISISNYGAGGNFRLSETIAIPNSDFMTMSGILGKFHELLAEVKRAQQ